MRRMILVLAPLLALLVSLPVVLASDTADDKEGVKVRRASILRKIVSAERLEQAAAQQYVALKQQASAKRALVPASHPQHQRLQRIANDLLPHTKKWNPRATEWKWEVSLIASNNINAFCMPGGKIAFFVGILERLKLTDDEVAMIMGHEMAHALREHARARVAKNNITQLGGRILGALLFGQVGEAIGAAGGSLLTLKFSRDDEKEADLIGMELAARAGYDPAAGITLWQKMDQAAKGAPPQWLSTHPASKARVKLIQDNLKDVAGLYERGRRARLAREQAAGQRGGIPTGEAGPKPGTPWGQPGAAGRPAERGVDGPTRGSPSSPPVREPSLPPQLPLPLPR